MRGRSRDERVGFQLSFVSALNKNPPGAACFGWGSPTTALPLRSCSCRAEVSPSPELSPRWSWATAGWPPGDTGAPAGLGLTARPCQPFQLFPPGICVLAPGSKQVLLWQSVGGCGRGGVGARWAACRRRQRSLAEQSVKASLTCW